MAKFLFTITVFVATVFVALMVSVPAQTGQPTKIAFGPIITAYFTNLAEELNELEYQIQQQEISRNDYTRSKQRLLLQKQYVEQQAIISGEDTVPDLQILTADEITTMLGISDIKSQNLRVGDVLAGKWKISGIEKRNERFFIFERSAKQISQQTRPKINPLDVIETITVYEPDPEELRPVVKASESPTQQPLRPEPRVAEVPRPSIRAMYLPMYTAKAREKKIEGKVVLIALFAHDGKLKDLAVEQKLGYGLDESAMNAAKQLTFDPAKVNNQPVDVRAHITYYFTLTHTSASIQPLAQTKSDHP
ncbi:MAG: energy transducer TonB [Blastocatellia bacterium]|nr:energy transducer TonB [Blastocatellia bacterium]